MKTQSSFPFAVALAAGLLLGALQPAFAQETTGTLTGHVIDAQGLAVPGAKITITGGQGVKSVTSDAQGRFSVPFLTPGTYTVRAEKNGFAPAEQKNVAVSIGTPIDVSVKLELETVSEARQRHHRRRSHQHDVNDDGCDAHERSAAAGARSAGPSATRCTWRRASAAPARRATRIRRLAAGPGSTTSTSSTAPTSRTWDTAPSGRIRSSSDRSDRRRRSTSSRKCRSRRAAMRPSSARPRAAW